MHATESPKKLGIKLLAKWRLLRKKRWGGWEEKPESMCKKATAARAARKVYPPQNRFPTPGIASHFAKSAPLIAVGVQVITGVLAAKKQVSFSCPPYLRGKEKTSLQAYPLCHCALLLHTIWRRRRRKKSISFSFSFFPLFFFSSIVLFSLYWSFVVSVGHLSCK